jgi:hypothetical protein
MHLTAKSFDISESFVHTLVMVVYPTDYSKVYDMTNSAKVKTDVLADVRMAGQRFAEFKLAHDKRIAPALLEHAKTVSTQQDVDAFCDGYAETLTGTDGSKRAQKSMVRTILKVLTATDDKLNTYHKIKKPADGRKVLDKAMLKSVGIDALSKALRVPPNKSDAANDAEPEGDGDTGTNETQSTLQAWWDECIKKGHSDKYGLTNDEMLAFIAQVIAK